MSATTLFANEKASDIFEGTYSLNVNYLFSFMPTEEDHKCSEKSFLKAINKCKRHGYINCEFVEGTSEKTALRRNKFKMTCFSYVRGSNGEI
jgi:hypothetical protein